MKFRRNLGISLAATALGLTVTAAGIASTAGTAQAYGKDTTKISCSAAKVRIHPAKDSAARGVAYKGDKMLYDQWDYKKSEKTWYTRGKVTRKDGAKIYGYVLYQCANPYGTDGAPTPKVPK
ncbi:hypothetical protein OG204_20895 [Streptomyces sp. NBC_01387]|uniref:hypothetical protein n=1 Tax=Streptomyces sp. NBC_01387 TaxID=2903849 RepID=UPI0032487EDA